MAINVDAAKDEFKLRKKSESLKALLRWVRPYWGHLAFCVLIAFLMNAAILAKPWIIKHVIDDYIAKGTARDVRVILCAVAYLAVVIIAAALAYVQTNYVTWIGQKVMFNLRSDLFRHIQNMSLSFFDRNSSGRILTRITTDVEALNELFSTVIVNVFRDSIMIIGIVVMMFALDVRLALFSVSCIPVLVAVTVIYRFAARKNFVKMKGMIARINGFLAENISGMKLVQIFHREREKYLELESLDGEYVTYSKREILLNSFSRPIVDVINNLTISVVIAACIGNIGNGSLKIGVIFAFVSYIKQFFEPISTIAEQYTTIQSAIVSGDRVLDILNTVESQEDASFGIEADSLRGKIEFRDVWFAYNDGNWVLRGVSFTIEPGQDVAFVGTTGSGKSTIIGLIARFYEIQRGQILIDGRDIREYNIRSLRRNVAVVIQDVFLFSGDIASNIRLGRESVTDDRIVEAANFVGIDKFVEKFPSGYQEPVKERGCTLSSGQKQLISFARAIAYNPSILVLDEATANIDTETERGIQNAMAGISGGKTMITIAHRLSTIRNADVIFVLDGGRILEFGRHETLLALDGVYNALYRLQQQDVFAVAL